MVHCSSEGTLSGKPIYGWPAHELGAENSKIVRVQNGTDPERFRPMDVRELKLEHGLAGRRILLSVGRLAPRKGFDTVIEALGEIVSAHPDTSM